MRGNLPGAGPVVIYDDDQAYMGGVIADHLAESCPDINLVTPSGTVSPWTVYTLEQKRIQASLIRRGVTLQVSQKVTGAGDGWAEMTCAYTGQARQIRAESTRRAEERRRATQSGANALLGDRAAV